MDPFDLWEDFDENEEEYEIIDEDNAFDEMFFSKMQFYKPKRISSNEVFRELTLGLCTSNPCTFSRSLICGVG